MGPIDVTTGDHNEPPCQAAKGLDESPRVLLGVGDHVHDDLGTELAEGVAVIGEVVSITDEMSDRDRQIRLGLTSMEDRDFVSVVDQLPHQRRADKVRTTDDEDSHGPTDSMGKRISGGKAYGSRHSRSACKDRARARSTEPFTSPPMSW